MRRRNKIRLQRRRRRKFFWLFAAAAVSALVFGEQVALLYVLSTLAMCGLLLVVAFSNLETGEVKLHAAPITKATDNVNASARYPSTEERKAA
jgi:hypothetical protein